MWKYSEPPTSDELYHHGILGQKWGVRRYQNEDGSLTPAGKMRYAKQAQRELNKKEKKAATDLLKLCLFSMTEETITQNSESLGAKFPKIAKFYEKVNRLDTYRKRISDVEASLKKNREEMDKIYSTVSSLSDYSFAYKRSSTFYFNSDMNYDKTIIRSKEDDRHRIGEHDTKRSYNKIVTRYQR